MWVRLRGLFIMIRILAPIIAVGAIWFTTAQAINAVEEATASYQDEVDARVERIREDVAGASDALTALGGFAIGIRDAISGQITAIGNIGNLSIPLPTIPVVNFNIPDIDVAVPGSEELKRLTAELAEVGDAIGEGLSEVTALGEVPTEVKAIADETTGFVTSVRDSLVRWAKVIGFVMAALIVIFVAGRIGKMLSELRRGWQMLSTGIDVRVDTLSDLLARVAVLERQVSR